MKHNIIYMKQKQVDTFNSQGLLHFVDSLSQHPTSHPNCYIPQMCRSIEYRDTLFVTLFRAGIAIISVSFDE